ncbi:MAG: hypothetical protein ACUVSK_10285, partial [Desulfotomaculales bacterium]
LLYRNDIPSSFIHLFPKKMNIRMNSGLTSSGKNRRALVFREPPSPCRQINAGRHAKPRILLQRIIFFLKFLSTGFNPLATIMLTQDSFL